MIHGHAVLEMMQDHIYTMEDLLKAIDEKFGADAFKRDLPNAVVKYVDSGHFALEPHHSEIAGYIKDFIR